MEMQFPCIVLKLLSCVVLCIDPTAIVGVVYSHSGLARGI